MNPFDVLSDESAEIPKRGRVILVLGKENAGIAIRLAEVMAHRESLRNVADRLEVRVAIGSDLQRISLHTPRTVIIRSTQERFGRDPGDVFAFEDVIPAEGLAKAKLAVLGGGTRSLSQAFASSIAVLMGNTTYLAPDRRKDNLNAQVNPYVPPGRSAAQLRQMARKRRK